VLHVCSEIFPYLKTGGLADVTAALPAALARMGCEIRMLVPGFPALLDSVPERHLVAEFSPRFGAHAIRLFYGILPQTEMPAYFIDAPGLYDRPGNPYVDIYGQPYRDNHRRFALLGWMAARLADGFDFFWQPQVVHGHDWHAGLAFAYIRALEWTRGKQLVGTLFTIHNMAYQGNFPGHFFGELDLPVACFQPDGIEFYGQVSFLKSGLFYANKVTTVSPSYAREIRWGEQACGLGGIAQRRGSDLVGILNGIDTGIWNPAKDEHIEKPYDARAITGKQQCRLALQEEMGLSPQRTAPIFCVVSRFAAQKGLHLLIESMETLLAQGGQVVIIGSGDHYLERTFQECAYRHPQQVAVRIGYDEGLAHRVIAGSDVILVPSRYEPCGLTQFYGLRYGTVPLVHRVGGLADSVADCAPDNTAGKTATGFCFDDFNASSFTHALQRAFDLFRQPAHWRQLQRQGMKHPSGWKPSARMYRALYDEVIARLCNKMP
jgi:starch synthase